MRIPRDAADPPLTQALLDSLPDDSTDFMNTSQKFIDEAGHFSIDVSADESVGGTRLMYKDEDLGISATKVSPKRERHASTSSMSATGQSMDSTGFAPTSRRRAGVVLKTEPEGPLAAPAAVLSDLFHASEYCVKTPNIRLPMQSDGEPLILNIEITTVPFREEGPGATSPGHVEEPGPRRRCCLAAVHPAGARQEPEGEPASLLDLGPCPIYRPKPARATTARPKPAAPNTTHPRLDLPAPVLAPREPPAEPGDGQ